MADESFLYACIRNGGLTRIALTDFSQSSAVIGTASSWSLAVWEDKLYAGTVDGKLLRLDRQTLKTEAVLPLSRQNVKSLYRSGSTLYAAGQNKKLYVIDLPTFSLTRKTSNIHPMMFDVIGEKNGVLYTVSHPACEISGWDKRGAKVCSIPYRLRLSGSSCIFGDAILVSSRNINGVDRIELSDVRGGDGCHANTNGDIVREEYRGRGVGRRLIEAAEAEIRKQLRPGWTATAALMSLKEVIHFYENLGGRSHFVTG